MFPSNLDKWRSLKVWKRPFILISVGYADDKYEKECKQ